MTCCDCQSVHPSPQPSGWALYAPSAHVQRRVASLLGGAGVHVEPMGPALGVPDTALESLRAIMGVLTLNELTELRAAPIVNGEALAWQAASLTDVIGRADSPWFELAARRLHFDLQPIVDVADARTLGFEALVRADVNGACLGAYPLLSAARAHGQLRAFDALARQEAIRSAAPQLLPDELLFVNFAPGVVYDPAICLQTTFATCREVGADFSRLVFEVTESEAFPDLKLLQGILDRYRQEGARVALDDLGAGHTSVLYLEQLRPDIVKLDRGLIAGIHPDDHRVPLVASLVRYAHDLGVRVVAEGIETTTEVELAVELGADYVQGYLLGRPAREMIRPDVRHLLARGGQPPVHG